MNHNTNSKSNNAFALTGVIVVCLLMSSGCRSLNSTFGSGANDGVQLPKLAFWKKGSEATSPPPPPAHHLNPSSTQALGQLADNARGAIGDMDQNISRITQAARNHTDKLAQAGSSSRTPYVVDESGIDKATEALKSKLSAGQNQFGRGLADAKDKLKSLEPNELLSLENPLANSKKVLANSKDAISNQVASAQQGIDNSFKSAADLRGASRDFKAAIAKKNAQLKTGIESAINNKPFDPALAKVNKSLYDMKGNLVSAGSGSKKSLNGTAEEARQRFSTALGTLNGRAAQVAKSSSDLGSGLKNKIAVAASELKQPLRSEGGSFKPAFEKVADPVSDQARGLLQQAKQKVAGLGTLGTGFDFPQPQAEPPSPTRLGGQLRSMANSGGTFGGGSGTKAAIETQPRPFSSGEFGRTRIANVTPVNDQGTVATKPAGLASTLTNAWNNGERQSQLKPIDVINNKTSAPGNVLRTASIRAGDLGASAAIPRFGNAHNVTVGHVSEIDIPQKVLSGSGSYAPGSVNKVR